MANKIHLLRNANREIKIVTACATNPHVNNTFRNARKTYANIPSACVVSWGEFKTTPAADRCAHCVEAALIIRNRQRKAKGLKPVATAFEVTCD